MSDPTDIFAWLRYNDRLTTSGQPLEEQLAILPMLGVRHVINLALHTHERALPDEAASVRALGMTYRHIPVEFDAPMEGDYSKFCDAMQDVGDEPVHVHCIVNARVSAFLYRYQRDQLNTDERRAREMLEKVWVPGGVWAAFIGDEESVLLPHRYNRQRR